MKNVAHTVLEFSLKDLEKANHQLFEVEKEFPEGSSDRDILFSIRIDIGKAISRLKSNSDEIGNDWGKLNKQ